MEITEIIINKAFTFTSLLIIY